MCGQMSSSALTSLYITIVQSYTGKYHEFVAICIVTSNNANSNKRVMFFPLYLDFIIRTLDFIACSDTVHVTYTNDAGSCVTCSKKKRLFNTVCSCKASALTPIH